MVWRCLQRARDRWRTSSACTAGTCGTGSSAAWRSRSPSAFRHSQSWTITIILQREIALLFVAAGILGIIVFGRVSSRITPLVDAPPSIFLFFFKTGLLVFGSGLAAAQDAGRRSISLADRPAISRRRCDRNDLARTGRHYRHVCRLSARWISRRGRRDCGHLPAAGALRRGCDAAAASLPIESGAAWFHSRHRHRRRRSAGGNDVADRSRRHRRHADAVDRRDMHDHPASLEPLARASDHRGRGRDRG